LEGVSRQDRVFLEGGKRKKKEGDGNDGLTKPSPYISFMGSVLP